MKWKLFDKYGKSMNSGAINIYDKKQSLKRYQKGLKIMRIYVCCPEFANTGLSHWTMNVQGWIVWIIIDKWWMLKK